MSNMTLNSLLRTDLVSFIFKCFHTLNPGIELVDSWYIECLVWELLRCQAGQCRRMVIAMPPRYGKSTIVSVAFPAWLLGHNPSFRIICASYSQELAFRLSADFRRIIESDWYRELFPDFAPQGDKCSEREVKTTANGWRYATSVGGPLTGIGGDIIIIDDAIKAADAKSEVERQKDPFLLARGPGGIRRDHFETARLTGQAPIHFAAKIFHNPPHIARGNIK